MTIKDVLTIAEARGVKLRVDGNDLVFRAPKGALTPELRKALADHKADLIAFFRAGDSTGDMPIARAHASELEPGPISAGQARMWFLDRLAPDSPIYNLYCGVRIRGALDRDRLAASLTALVARHPMLRARFPELEHPTAIVDPPSAWALPTVDLRNDPDREAALARFVQASSTSRFDLGRGPLLRTTLVVLADDHHVLCLDQHHITTDATSMVIMARDLFALYRGAPELPELPVRYSDYVHWQATELASDAANVEQAWWVDKLSDLPRLELPAARDAVPGHDGDACSFELSPELTDKLKDLAREHGCTLFVTLLAVWTTLLHRYSRQTEFGVGTVTAGRERAELADVVGFFVNTLVLRCDLTGDPEFATVMTRLRATVGDALAHQALPFDRVVKAIGAPRGRDLNPLFRASFGLESTRPPDLVVDGMEWIPQMQRVDAGVDGTAKFELGLVLVERGGGLVATLEYATALYDASTVARVAEQFTRLAEAAVATPNARIADLPLLSDAERHELVVARNATAMAVPTDVCLHELFEAQAARTPDAIALVCGDVALSYAELATRVRRLARHLRGLGVGPDVLVGICTKRGPEMVVGILAVLEAGGGYVPLDPAYPPARLAYMLSDSGAAVVLTQREVADRVPSGLVIDELDLDGVAPALAPTATPANLAYCIYTSGSTGQPKGVAIEHASAVAFVTWARATFDRADLRRVLFSTSICFDLSVFELFVPLATGGAVVLVDNALALLDRDVDTTLINTVPSAAQALVEASRMPKVRVINLAGEPLRRELADRMHAAVPSARIYNLYGPTEYTTYATYGQVAEAGAVTIGRPLANTQIYLLDDRLAPVPRGAAGEIYIAGVGLARGYLHRAELTADRFVANPFGPGRMYRTGDLGRYRGDGEIDYLGRIDHQVKIRGFRIELGEIETALRGAGARDAVVVARDNTLAAYVVGDVHESDLRAALAERLPEHMMPSAFVSLDALPLTPNGKIDRKALPVPARSEGVFVAPRTPVEEMIAGIWADVLSCPRVGVTDDFFALGGHSLIATQVTSRLRTAFGIDVPIRALFEAPTVAALAARLGASAPERRAALQHHDASDELPLSFAQQRLWFLDRLEPGSSLYNIPAAVRLVGPLDTTALEASLQTIVSRHDALRTSFPERGGRARQLVSPSHDLVLAIVDVGCDEVTARVQAEADRPFDLARGPLVRATLLRVDSRDHVLVLVFHHTIADGWSMGVILRELAALYTGQPLPVLSIQYADYTRWQRRELAGDRLENEVAYWKQQLAGAPLALELATDRPRPAVSRHRGGVVRLALPVELARDVAATSRREGVTSFMTLLAAWQMLLARYSGQTDIVVGTPIAGRTEAETEPLIGLFVNSLALRTDLSGSPTVRDVLRRVRDVTLGAYAHQAVPFEKLLEHVAPERDTSRSPVFQVMFVLQNAPLPELRIGDVDLEILDVDSTTAKFELTLSLQETRSGLVGSIEYDRDLFDRSTIERMARHYQRLLEGIIGDPARSIASVPIVDTAERADLLVRAGGDVTYEDARCIHQLFEEQVERHGSAIALTCGNTRVTYRELDARANQLAHHLTAHGVRAGDRVALCLDRSFDMIAAIVGVLKTGAAYVPLEPSLPPERLAYILDDIGQPVVIAGGSARGAELGSRVIDVEADRLAIDARPTRSPDVCVDPHACAYIIYTSGSTGKAKGVEVSHANVVRLFTSTDRWFQFGHRDVWTLFHSYAFDFSVWEIWGALLYGGRLVVVPYETSRSPDSFFDLLVREGVTVLNQTPSAFRLLVATDTGAPLALRTVIFGGEAVDLTSLRPWFARRGDARPRLVNMYGITETTVHVTYRPLGIADLDGGTNPIGIPIPDLRVYVLDENRQLVPVGVPGELYVGGAGVALGYLHRPELTAARFVDDPFAPGTRLYRTGDRGRWLTGGGLDYLGRIDHQVKIRGFRIELGEIEAVLSRHPALAEVLVIARGDRLLAYVVATGEVPSAGELRAFLAPKLPDYMIPAAFVALPAMPLNANGKIDRKALPEPERVRPELAGAFAAPRTPAEEILSRIWADVLGLERVGIDDKFFDLGGDSILSIQVVAAARDAGLPLSVRAVFQHPTIRELAQHAGDDREDVTIAPFQMIAATDRTELPDHVVDAYPLAQLQAGMVFHGAGSSLYHDIASFHVEVAFEPAQVRLALDQLTAAHPILRTSFDFDRFSEPLQLVHRHAEIPLTGEDWRHLSHDDQEVALTACIEADKQRGFDITKAPLARLYLHRRSDRSSQLTLVNHHAILDGWSVAALITELIQRLVGHSAGAAPTCHYREFVALERAALASPETWRFWDARTNDAPTTVIPRGDATTPQPARRLVEIAVPRATTTGLRDLARAAGVPLKSALLAAHVRALAAITGEREVVTGVVANGRPEARDAERALGLFLNTLPFRQRVDTGTWVDLVRHTFATERDLLPHRRYPLAELQRRHGGALFDTAFNFIHFHVYQSLGDAQLARVLGYRSYEETNFRFLVNFSLDLAETALSLQLSISAPDLTDDQVEEIAGMYRRVLDAMAATPEAEIRSVATMAPEIQHRVLVDFNATALPVPEDVCLHEMFEAQVARTPEAIALACGELELSYAALAARVHELAHHLRGLGVGPDMLVGVCTTRGPAMVVGILAILEAGGGYVPLDPAYPPARLAYMLADSRATVVLTERAVADRLPEQGTRLVLDELELDAPRMPLARTARPANLAYCIYTSGSTGQPKGVAIEHASAVAFVAWAQATFDRDDLARVLFSTSICFDLSVFELFVPLATGGTVVLVDNALALFDRDVGASLINTVPSAAQALVDAGRVREARVINLAGEPLRRELADALHAAVPGARIYNLYGPTEYTTYATYCRVPEIGAITIGRPLANTQVYLLDDRLAPVAPGKVGQIFIAGAGLARGYLHRDDLTAERFVANPFGAGRMYRTGDLGRYRADGEIEFLGRIDHQVKIRGFRIELGEIETVLRSAGGVRDAVVVARDNSLVAYVVGDAREDDIRAVLRERLPDYMVPAVFVWLAALPLTPNGKIDRKALPAPDRIDAPAFVPPRTPVEEVIAAIWSEVLGCARVGATDDFFALGGHSLVATRVINRLRVAFGIELSIRALFEAPTLDALGRRVQLALGAAPMSDEPIVREPSSGEIPLSFAQQRLWFLDRLQPGTNRYNIPVVARLTGELDVAALARSVRALVSRHDVLRTHFPEHAGRAYQAIASDGSELAVVDATTGDVWERVQAETDRPFDLARGPLVRATVFAVGERDHVLVIALHHAIADGWSIGVLIRELGALYAGSALPALEIQYADYTRWQRRRLTGDVLDDELAYWTKQLVGAPRALELVTDRPRPAVVGYRGAAVPISLPVELARDLAAANRREGVTMFMSLLAAWQLLLARYSGQDDIVVGTPIAGRTHAATEPLIGLFVNTLALRTDLSGPPTARELLRRVREVTLGAYAHQAVPFEKLLEHLAIPRDTSRSPVFQVMFALQNTPLPELQLGGLAFDVVPVETTSAKFELTLALAETVTGIVGEIEYDRDLYDRSTIERMVTDYAKLVSAFAGDASRPISELAMETRVERHERQVDVDTEAAPRPIRDVVAPLEVDLARIWEEELGITGVRPRDSYFTLGGHSLSAVALLARIAASLGEVSLARFFQEPTIEGLADQLRGALTRSWSPLVAIQPDGRGRPLFCVHPGLGSIARYDALARQLGTTRPFYALCAFGLDREQVPDRRVEEMAARYVGAIRTIQPAGPYLLGGHSFGGLVAYEMAQQLIRAGQRVDMVALLDTVPPGPAWRELEAHDARVIHGVLDEAGVPITEDYARLDPDAQIERCLAALLAAGSIPSWFDAEHVRRMVTWRARIVPAAYRDYVPAPFPGTVTLLRASEADEPFAGWADLARVVEHRVPGDHHSMLRQPNLEALAARLASCLDAIDPPGQPQ